MSTDITIFEPQNFGAVVETAPQAYSENRVSMERCVAFGNGLLQRAQTEGMSDALDRDIALYIERAKKTVRKMNGKRAAITQLFDGIRSVYTGLENEVDPTRKGTVPAQLQDLRNRYAARKREEHEAEMRRRQAEQAKANAKTKYAADVEEDLQRQFKSLTTEAYNRLVELDRTLTLENYETNAGLIGATADQLPQDWFDRLSASQPLPPCLSTDEARAIADKVKEGLRQRFDEHYQFVVSTNRDGILDRLPSKRKELERMERSGKEEAERIRKQMEEQECREAERREAERMEREAKEKAAADLAAQKREMESLFGQSEVQAAQAYQPKTTVKKRINVLNPEGFMQVVGMWWAQYGCTLTVAELEKTFSKQLTFCNRLANDKDNPLLIQSEHIEYVDDVKAK